MKTTRQDVREYVRQLLRDRMVEVERLSTRVHAHPDENSVAMFDALAEEYCLLTEAERELVSR